MSVRSFLLFLAGLTAGLIIMYIVSTLLFEHISSILMVVSTVVMAFFTALVWHIELSKFNRIYNPELRVHEYPLTLDYRRSQVVEASSHCLRLRLALVNPGGVPISIMGDRISLIKADSEKHIKTLSEFAPPESRPPGLYVTQFPWVIKDFCIYEKIIYPEELKLRKTFANQDWEVHVQLEYEVEPRKLKKTACKLRWQRKQTEIK